ncbi:MAG: capsular biosynthesis protein [Sphingobacteriales bacterium]|nr:MAG: capsular biosynthesis protein [Sphingobacteriales bacterium]
MGFLSGLFGKKNNIHEPVENPFMVDMHSHLLPGIDDGSESFDESVEMISGLVALGYKKFITTPHVMQDFYKNSPENIIPLCEKLNAVLKEKNIDATVHPSAEYMLDENFEKILEEGNLLSFGPKKYVVVETSYLSAPPNFNEYIFNLNIAGYSPILAHPERYTYMYDDFDKYKKLFDRNLCFQLNLASLGGYYSKEAKKIAERLIKENMVNFVGTDIHHTRHVGVMKFAQESQAFAELTKLNILNNSLL